MLCGQYGGLFFRFILLILGVSLIASLTISNKKRSGGFLKKDFRDRLFVLTFIFQFLAQFMPACQFFASSVEFRPAFTPSLNSAELGEFILNVDPSGMESVQLLAYCAPRVQAAVFARATSGSPTRSSKSVR